MRILASILAVGVSVPAWSDPTPVVMDTLVISATRAEARAFDVPAAIATVDAETIGAAGAQVNLSEALSRVPGITALNRQNYSQDLQLSIRGFGSRSTFGIRGVRLIVDGIPATMPDGQGQASNVSLASTTRVEVLRGPLALLYGNAAGGVVQVFTAAGASSPTAALSSSRGSFGASRIGAGFAATDGTLRYTLDASRFETNGYRDHSAARRDQLNAKFSWQALAATRIDVVVNALDQPEALDPLGLTRSQLQANPRQASAIAFTQDASKTVRQQQAGVVVDHSVDPDTTVVARAYVGARSLDNKLSIPPAAQLPPTSSGGIVSFDRAYGGAGLQLSRRFVLGEGGVARIVAGVEHDRMKDDRQGYLNNAGVRGELRRDEDDRVTNTDGLLQATFDTQRWSAIAGVRASRVAFETRDRYVAPGNPDDSGSVQYRAVTPVAGLTFHAAPQVNVYANAGRGFETPTFTELAYRNNASGLNTALNDSRSTHVEAGAKWRASNHLLDAAAFDIRTHDEIIVDANVGGRSTFRNAGRTTRRGFELGYAGQWLPQLRVTAAFTALDARFENGNRLPGTPPRSAFVEAAWMPRDFVRAAIEIAHVGRLYVNDANEDFAPAATVVNLRVGAKLAWGPLEIQPLVRLENATDRKYAGSVIVNEANRRFFEPAPPRSWLAALAIRYRF